MPSRLSSSFHTCPTYGILGREGSRRHHACIAESRERENGGRLLLRFQGATAVFLRIMSFFPFLFLSSTYFVPFFLPLVSWGGAFRGFYHGVRIWWGVECSLDLGGLVLLLVLYGEGGAEGSKCSSNGKDEAGSSCWIQLCLGFLQPWSRGYRGRTSARARNVRLYVVMQQTGDASNISAHDPCHPPRALTSRKLRFRSAPGAEDVPAARSPRLADGLGGAAQRGATDSPSTPCGSTIACPSCGNYTPLHKSSYGPGHVGLLPGPVAF